MNDCALCGRSPESATSYTVHTARVTKHSTMYQYDHPQMHRYAVCKTCRTKWTVAVPAAIWMGALALTTVLGIVWAGAIGVLGLAFLFLPVAWGLTNLVTDIEGRLVRRAAAERGEGYVGFTPEEWRDLLMRTGAPRQ